MSVAKKQIYIEAEISWANEKLQQWKEYVDSNPLATLTDRIAYKQMKGGGTMPMVVANIESQIKCIRDTMKEYLVLLEQVNKMRQVEESKQKEARGSSNVPAAMRLSNREVNGA